MKILLTITIALISIMSLSYTADADVYLRGALGPSGLSLHDSDVTIGGGGGDLSLAAGITLGTGMAIYGELVGIAVQDPKVSYGGHTGTCTNCSVGVGSGLLPGVGVTAYTPTGWNIHSSLHLLEMSADIEGDKYESDRGFVTFLTGGKEFSVSDGVNLGLAIKLGAGTIEETSVTTFSIQGVVSYY